MRDRLIELVMECSTFTPEFKDFARLHAEYVANHLLANGVIIPPCKVGDTVWFETRKKNATECIGIRPHTVDRIDVIAVCDIEGITPTKLYDWEFGKNVFLTQEEAEKRVEELRGENNG